MIHTNTLTRDPNGRSSEYRKKTLNADEIFIFSLKINFRNSQPVNVRFCGLFISCGNLRFSNIVFLLFSHRFDIDATANKYWGWIGSDYVCSHLKSAQIQQQNPEYLSNSLSLNGPPDYAKTNPTARQNILHVFRANSPSNQFCAFSWICATLRDLPHTKQEYTILILDFDNERIVFAYYMWWLCIKWCGIQQTSIAWIFDVIS